VGLLPRDLANVRLAHLRVALWEQDLAAGATCTVVRRPRLRRRVDASAAAIVAIVAASTVHANAAGAAAATAAATSSLLVTSQRRGRKRHVAAVVRVGVVVGGVLFVGLTHWLYLHSSRHGTAGAGVGRMTVAANTAGCPQCNVP
jgi:hypothetical protein